MTYIEWRDELSGYLTGLSETERKKIFDYYSEMYADKRDLGRSEKDAIADFGAPYDVAQKILSGDIGEETKNAAPAAPVNPDEGKNSAAVTTQKGGAKRVIIAIAWAILGILLISWASTELAEAIDAIYNTVLDFGTGDAYTAIVAIGKFTMHVGFMIIIICLIVMVAKKLIAAIKAIKGE